MLQLEKRYRQLTGGEFSLILERFRELSVVIGRDIKLDSVNGVTAGRAIDIDNNGFLTVRDVMGNIHNVMSGEIFLKAPRDNHK